MEYHVKNYIYSQGSKIINFLRKLFNFEVMAVAPQSVTLGSTNIRIPHGILVTSNAGVSSNFMVSPKFSKYFLQINSSNYSAN